MPCILGYRQTYMFVRFKLGCHGLAIVTGRWHGVPRMQRVCSRCDMSALDDERHLVFECPVFEDLRRELRTIVVGYVTPRPRYACAVRTVRVPVPGTRTQVYSSQEAATCVLAVY